MMLAYLVFEAVLALLDLFHPHAHLVELLYQVAIACATGSDSLA